MARAKQPSRKKLSRLMSKLALGFLGIGLLLGLTAVALTLIWFFAPVVLAAFVPMVAIGLAIGGGRLFDRCGDF